MRNMHIMLRKNSKTHLGYALRLIAGAAQCSGAGVAADRTFAVKCRGRNGARAPGAKPGRTTGLGARIEAMCASGMSATAVRRALALNAVEAMAYGLLPPTCAKAPPGRPAGALAQTGPVMMDVVDAVARACALGREDLLGRGQARPLARARHLAMYLVRELCPGASLPAIGHLLDRDHTTVLYGCRRAAALRARDAGFRDLCARVCRELAS